MKSIIFPLLVAAAALLVASTLPMQCSAECYSDGECLYSNETWDFVIYASRWLGSTTTAHIPSFVNSFTIHGVWPNFEDGDYPCECTDTPFNVTQINPIRPQLEVAWYDFDGINSTSLWSHEWEKHGTCATSQNLPGLTDEYDYFNLGIKLHSEIDLMQVLINGGITPSASQTYSFDQIIDTFKSGIGHNVFIECAEYNGKQLLQNAYLCVSNKNWEVEQCPSCIAQNYADNTHCPSDGIYWPPMNYLYDEALKVTVNDI